MKVLLTLLILGLCLADEAEPTGGLKIDISMTQNEDDYGKCDLDIEINNQKWPAQRGGHGAVACFASMEDSYGDWNKTKTYQGWVFGGLVSEIETKWNEMEDVSMSNANMMWAEVMWAKDDNDDDAWCWRVPENKSKIENEQTFSFKNDEQETHAKLNKPDIHYMMKWDNNPYTCFYWRYNHDQTSMPSWNLNEWTSRFDNTDIEFDSESCNIHEWWKKPVQNLINRNNRLQCLLDTANDSIFLSTTCAAGIAAATLLF